MSTFTPRVSVIIPAYNAERYIAECLQSMIDQTESSLEILVINDGSTDKTREIAERWAKHDDRIQVLHKENGGAASARNLGFDHVRGKYIAVQDVDDFSHPSRLQQQADFLEHNGSIKYVGTFAKRIGLNNVSLGFITPPTDGEIIRDRMRTQISYVHSSLMFHRDVIDEGFRYDSSLVSSEDWEMLTRLVQRHDGANIPEPLYFYRNTEDQLTQKYAVVGAIRSIWAREQSQRRRDNQPLLRELPRFPTRHDAIEVGLDINLVDRAVLSRFELILRLNRRANLAEENRKLADRIESYALQTSFTLQPEFRALLFFYIRPNEWNYVLIQPSLQRAVRQLLVREARYYSHILKRGWEYRRWDYQPLPVIS